MTSTPVDAESDSVVLYDIEDRSPLGEAIPLGARHVLTMFPGNATSPLIFTDAVGPMSGQMTFLVQMALIIAGAATPVQAFPVGPVGMRLPIAMETSLAFPGPLIGTSQQSGIAAVFGTPSLVAPVELVMGVMFDRFQKYFPSLVTGIVAMFIGPTSTPTGMNCIAGVLADPPAAGYDSLANLGLVGFVLVAMVVLNQFFDGFLHVVSVSIGIVVGHIAVIVLGMVSSTAVATAGWITVLTLLRFGLGFPPSAVFMVMFLYVAISLETIDDISGTTLATGRNPTRKEFHGGLVADAVVSAFAVLLNVLLNTSFSQDIGLVSFTSTASRHVAGIGEVVLVMLGFVPGVGAVVSVIPDAVPGGDVLVLLAMILSSGTRITTQNVTLNHWSSTIPALSMVFGPGVASRPKVLQNFLAKVQTLFGSVLVTSGFVTLTLNVVLPGGGADLGPAEYVDGPDSEDPTKLSSFESPPPVPVDD